MDEVDRILTETDKIVVITIPVLRHACNLKKTATKSDTLKQPRREIIQRANDLIESGQEIMRLAKNIK